ncbi:MAG: PASTA domain-containing protein [Elusimicrobiales bacterium]|nr:PASTA domain-containing protein [Elusimicrobiales bacterium]HPO96162.1 PASTA domain-containing protein [Elusimicrobiales bacterium]
MNKDILLNYKYFLKIIGVILALSFFSYFMINWAIESVVHSRKEVIVPDIKGKSALTALSLLSENNLAMQIQGFEFDSSVPVGTVLRQNPQSGINVREGRIIKVIFSQGGESVFVPNLIGMPIRNAELLLRQRQLILGEVTESYSMKFDKGIVMYQEPKVDSQVSKNTYVNLIVSAGNPPKGVILMPDFRQKKISEFYKWVESNPKIKYRIERESKTIFPKETIIDQKPEYDTQLSEDTEVVVTISDNDADKNIEEYKIVYNLSQSGSQRNVRIVAISKTGDKEIFNALRDPGSKIEISIPKSSAEKIRIFVNGILIEERQVK